MTDTVLQLFVGYSLVDITATGVIRSQDNNSVDRNQQRNWETILQCISLRTQPHNVHGPLVSEELLENYEFGDFYTGRQKIWVWTWSVESKEVYDLPGNPLSGLLQDFEQVPIITGLTETAKFMLPIFYPYGTIKNIYIKQQVME